MPKYVAKNLNKLENKAFCPIQKHLESVDFHKNRLWKLYKGILTTSEGGREYTRAEFEAKFEAYNPVSFRGSPENADGTKDFLK